MKSLLESPVFQMASHHWVDAPPAFLRTVQWLYDFVQFLKLYCCIHLPQKMTGRHEAFCVHHFYNPPLMLSSFQHLSHPYPILFYCIY